MNEELSSMVAAIDYMESNLKEKLYVDDVAYVTGYSKYYFSRQFAKLTGYSPYDYYLGRKVTEAIIHLNHYGGKIIDTALEYGFNSPEVFARACTSIFGEAPSSIRKKVEANIFKGVERIDLPYLRFIDHQKVPPKLKYMDELELSGIGYFSNTYETTLLSMRQEQFEDIDYVAEEDLYKVTWMDQQSRGYMHFIGQSNKVGITVPKLLVNRMPKMFYMVFEMNEATLNIDFYYRYLHDRFLSGTEIQEVLSYHVERLWFEESIPCSQLFIPVIPKK